MARLGKRGPKKRLSRDTAEFFKVFLPRLPGYHQLMISPDFVKDFKRTIRERVLLKDLCGKEWHVYVNETPDGIFLKNGWEKLADYHSLTMGEFLVFRYDGAYSFIVKIFGTNGCKKKKKDLDNARVKIEDEMDQSLIPYDTQHSKRFEEVKESEEQNMSSKSSSFTSPGGIKSSSKLRILDEMIKEHNLKFEEEIILRNENGKEWPVNIITGRKDVKLFGKGWYDFQRDNNVGSNPCKFTFDNKSSPCRMANVQILRSGSDPSPKKTLKRGRGRPKKIETDICRVQVKSCDEKVAYSDELPEFFKIYVADESSETMRLPPDFIEEFGKDIPETCTLENPSGLSWKVEMKRVHDHCFFQNGWPEFVHENSLQDYDFLTFAYARNSTFYVKVYLRNGCLKVAEKNDDETTENLLENEASQQENPKSRSNTRRSTRTTTETLLVIEASQQENPKNRRISRSSTRTESSMERKSVNRNPSFKREITKSYLMNSYLTIPKPFWNSHMRKGSGMVTVWIKNKRWNMTLRNTGDRINLVDGVSYFARMNSLKIGSVCTFELIDSNKLAFKVTVDR